MDNGNDPPTHWKFPDEKYGISVALWYNGRLMACCCYCYMQLFVNNSCILLMVAATDHQTVVN